jgi:hypothetical protein
MITSALAPVEKRIGIDRKCTAKRKFDDECKKTFATKSANSGPPSEAFAAVRTSAAARSNMVGGYATSAFWRQETKCECDLL